MPKVFWFIWTYDGDWFYPFSAENINMALTLLFLQVLR